jgi:hypothetical protein
MSQLLLNAVQPVLSDALGAIGLAVPETIGKAPLFSGLLAILSAIGVIYSAIENAFPHYSPSVQINAKHIKTLPDNPSQVDLTQDSKMNFYQPLIGKVNDWSIAMGLSKVPEIHVLKKASPKPAAPKNKGSDCKLFARTRPVILLDPAFTAKEATGEPVEVTINPGKFEEHAGKILAEPISNFIVGHKLTKDDLEAIFDASDKPVKIKIQTNAFMNHFKIAKEKNSQVKDSNVKEKLDRNVDNFNGFIDQINNGETKPEDIKEFLVKTEMAKIKMNHTWKKIAILAVYSLAIAAITFSDVSPEVLAISSSVGTIGLFILNAYIGRKFELQAEKAAADSSDTARRGGRAFFLMMGRRNYLERERFLSSSSRIDKIVGRILYTKNCDNRFSLHSASFLKRLNNIAKIDNIQGIELSPSANQVVNYREELLSIFEKHEEPRQVRLSDSILNSNVFKSAASFGNAFAPLVQNKPEGEGEGDSPPQRNWTQSFTTSIRNLNPFHHAAQPATE